MVPSLLFLIPISYVRLTYGSPCVGENVTTYLRSEGMRLMEFPTYILKEGTLNTCVDACTSEANGHLCTSFEYDSRTQECSMHREDGQPFGPSVLTLAETPIAFFQQICVKADNLCSTPYAFERYPQSILIGHAMKVISVNGLSECLSRCLSAPSLLRMQCRSIMYYYETGECILNREVRSDKPELFRDGIQEDLVDYFENNCDNVDCQDTSLHWVRTEEYSITHEKDVIIESMDMEECKAVCTANLIGTEKFPCRAFVFSASKQECHLSAESGYIGRKTKSFNLNPISTGEYFEKYCLNSTFQCVEASFEQIPNRKMDSEPYKSFDSQSVHECLSACLDDGQQCATAVYDYQEDRCHLSEISQFTHPDQFTIAENVDYFDKICDVTSSPSNFERKAAKGTPNLHVGSTEEPLVLLKKSSSKGKVDGLESTSTVISATKSPKVSETDAEIEGTVIDDNEDFENTVNHQTVKARLTMECRISGITVSVFFASPTSGSIYIKDHFSTCKTEFFNTTLAELHIPYPKSDETNPRCPGLELAPSQWNFMVVVQKNEMNSPSLVTTSDRVFNVSCDYTKLVSRERGLRPNSDGLELKSKKIRMQILHGGQSVTTVPLGEEVELSWSVLDGFSDLGFFINECIAERVGGLSPEPEPLKIIHEGCPDENVRNKLLRFPISQTSNGFSTKMKVFRFDGSRRVRIKCIIDVCIDHCPSVSCDGLDSSIRESFGRKKRQSTEDLIGLLKKLKPNFGMGAQQAEVFSTNANGKKERRTVSGILTITDRKLTKTRRQRPEFSSMSLDQYCFLRSHIVVVIIGLLLLAVFQLFLLLNCLHNRCIHQHQDNSSCSSSQTGDTSSSYHYDSSSIHRRNLPALIPRKVSAREYEIPFHSR